MGPQELARLQQLPPPTGEALALPIPEGIITSEQMADDAVRQPGAHRKPSRLTQIKSDLGNVKDGLGEDYATTSNKAVLIACGIGAAVIQGLDRARASVVFVPPLAIEVLENTNSPLQAGIAGGAAFGACCLAVGGTTTEALNQFPKTSEKFEESFPTVVDFFEDALPGIQKPEESERNKNVLKRIGNSALTRIKRGYTVTGLGTTAYTATSFVKNRNRKDTHFLNANASLDGGAAIAVVAYGAARVITEISEDHPEVAQNILNTVENTKFWLGIAALMIAQNYVSNKMKQRKAANEPTES